LFYCKFTITHTFYEDCSRSGVVCGIVYGLKCWLWSIRFQKDRQRHCIVWKIHLYTIIIKVMVL